MKGPGCAGRPEAGIVDQEVDRDAARAQLVAEPAGRIGCGEVERDDVRRDAGRRLDLARQLVEAVAAARDQDHVVAVGGEQGRVVASQSRRGAGDERRALHEHDASPRAFIPSIRGQRFARRP